MGVISSFQSRFACNPYYSVSVYFHSDFTNISFAIRKLLSCEQYFPTPSGQPDDITTAKAVRLKAMIDGVCVVHAGFLKIFKVTGI